MNTLNVIKVILVKKPILIICYFISMNNPLLYVIIHNYVLLYANEAGWHIIDMTWIPVFQFWLLLCGYSVVCINVPHLAIFNKSNVVFQK